MATCSDSKLRLDGPDDASLHEFVNVLLGVVPLRSRKMMSMKAWTEAKIRARVLVDCEYRPQPQEIPALREFGGALSNFEKFIASHRALDYSRPETVDIGLRFLAMLEAAEVSNEMPKAAKTVKRTL